MKEATNSPVELLRPTKVSKQKVYSPKDSKDACSDTPASTVTSSTDHVQGLQKVRQIGDLIHNWEKIPSRKATLARARQWLQSEFYDQHGETVRTLRLKKGWSQTQLAEALGTSQSHIARIERGDQNLAIQTCRKLAAVLGVDMNTLDHALRVQEALAALKSAR